MSEHHTHASTWKSRINALGPGIMMASAAVGGSHLIASTQAGAVAVVTAAIVKMAIPSLTLYVGAISALIMVSCLIILASGRYKALDNVSKIIIVSLTIATVAAAAIAMSRGMQMKPDFIEPTPWTFTALGFLIALMGWMPAPIEISAINSLWVTEKQRLNPSSYRDGIFDFNVGYITSAVLAVVFLALGAYVQYGNGEAVKMKGGEYVGQLINMYAVTIGDWSRPMVAFIAFACMYGTTITVVDGYARAIAEPVRLLRGKDKTGNLELFAWNVWVAGTGLAVIFWFNSAMAELLKFAMITAFVAAPVFAWLNYRLVKDDKRHKLTAGMNVLAILGLVYLIGFTVLFLFDLGGAFKDFK